jgi:hypothetical protein
MTRALLVFISIFLFTDSIWAQKKGLFNFGKTEEERLEKRKRINDMIRSEEEGIAAFEKHTLFSIKTHHNGYGVLFEKGVSKSAYASTIFQFEFSEKQHPKEEKQSSTDFTNTGFAIFGRPFVYGKQNIFYQVKGGIGRQILIGGKGNKNGVGVYAVFVGGFAAGLTRPYYMEFTDPGGTTKIKFSEADRSLFLSADRIIGGTGLQLGWNEMKFVPGVYAKAGLRFDWARFNQVISAIEFGFGLDYFTGKVVQMVDNPGRSLFPMGYIGLSFGNRK